MKRQYMGCAGRVANGISTVHLAYVREKTGHALAGARQWIPREHLEDPEKAQATGLPENLEFRTEGELAIEILDDAYADGLTFDFVAGDEAYGSCTRLRGHLEEQGQAYVLRVASSFPLPLPAGAVTCADAASKLLNGTKRWEIRSAGRGSKGERWYAWAWLATASPRHTLLVRRHLGTGELAFHYCYVPEGQVLSKARLHTAIRRHLVLVMAALAVCALAAARLRKRSGTQAAPPTSSQAAPPADLGLVPFSVR